DEDAITSIYSVTITKEDRGTAAGNNENKGDADLARPVSIRSGSRSPTPRDRAPQKEGLGGTPGSRDEVQHTSKVPGTPMGPGTPMAWRDPDEESEDREGWDDWYIVPDIL
ncbi:uncharacterized protein CC84DRAFT_1182180, partial [Paraphaeosphaeria sporulosa]